MALSELGGGGYFSNIIAPCSLDQVMEMVFKLGDIQRHPFMQVLQPNNVCMGIINCGAILAANVYRIKLQCFPYLQYCKYSLNICLSTMAQAAAAQAKVGPLAICGTCLDNKSCDVIPLKLFVPPPPTLQLFA